jgi:hypothetical protein
MKKQCAKCNEPTKAPIGFWDGKDKNGRPTGGLVFSCSNSECPIKQEEARLEQRAMQRIKEAQAENHQNGIDIQEMVRARRRAEMTVRDCAKVLGVTLPQYSDYERERVPMPKEYWSRIIEASKKE